MKILSMAANNENQHEQTGDYRPRWSAGKDMDRCCGCSAVSHSRRCRGSSSGGGADRLAAWRDDFLEGGKEALKGQRPDRSGDDRALKQAERKVGQLTMENEILRAAAEKGGSRYRRRSGPIAMAHQLPMVAGAGCLARRAPRCTPAANRRCRPALDRSPRCVDHDSLGRT